MGLGRAARQAGALQIMAPAAHDLQLSGLATVGRGVANDASRSVRLEPSDQRARVELDLGAG